MVPTVIEEEEKEGRNETKKINKTIKQSNEDFSIDSVVDTERVSFRVSEETIRDELSGMSYLIRWVWMR
jgi:hypothetical protein